MKKKYKREIKKEEERYKERKTKKEILRRRKNVSNLHFNKIKLQKRVG